MYLIGPPTAVNYGQSTIRTRHSEVDCRTLDLNPTTTGEMLSVGKRCPGQDAPTQTNTISCGLTPIA